MTVERNSRPPIYHRSRPVRGRVGGISTIEFKPRDFINRPIGRSMQHHERLRARDAARCRTRFPQEDHAVNRRTFLSAVAATPALGVLRPSEAAAELPKAKVTRVRIYRPPDLNPLFNQSNMVVTVETSIGITGIGEGGAKDTLEQCAGTLIGQNPFRTEALWQEAYIAWFYPPGREKAHALGALDLALWDIKGKALGLPVHELLGGSARNYCECYATGGVTPPGVAGGRVTLKERARATMEAGYRAFRMAPSDVPVGDVYDTRSVVRRVEQDCRDVRDGVGPDGNWCIDLHQRFD